MSGRRCAVLGCGSIGRRHIANLQALGRDVVAYNRGTPRREAAARDFGIPVFDDRARLLRETAPDMVVVCTPNNVHEADILAALDAGAALFVEKPLSHDAASVVRLSARLADRAVFCQVGSNMRYHYGPEAVARVLRQGTLGRPLWGELWGRMYLPDWHPDEDHRQMYSARAGLGGGALLDFVHEFDLALWLFGEPRRVAAMAGNTGWLGIETEEVGDVILGYDGGLQVHIHVDYLERPAQRGIRIVGEKGTVVWDMNAETVALQPLSGAARTVAGPPPGWEKNSMYRRQWEDVLAAFDAGRPAPVGFSAGANAVHLVVRAKAANRALLEETTQ